MGATRSSSGSAGGSTSAGGRSVLSVSRVKDPLRPGITLS